MSPNQNFYLVGNLEDVKKELLVSLRELNIRGLKISYQWCVDLLHSLVVGNLPKQRKKKKCLNAYKKYDPEVFKRSQTNRNDLAEITVPNSEACAFLHAQRCFELKEYKRSSNLLKKCHSNVANFLKYYSEYLAADVTIKNIGCEATPAMFDEYRNSLDGILSNLVLLQADNLDDGYFLYLLGLVFVKLEKYDEAVEVLLESIRLKPLNWHAWMQLGDLIVDRVKLSKLDLPNHWMKNFFFCQKYLDLQLNEQMLAVSQYLINCGFINSTFLLSRVAVCYHNKRYVETALQKFHELIEVEPYRLENMDTYSNLLYVQHQRAELAYLAQRAVKIDKYRVETCCILGNYYSLNSEHQKAMRYFLRALKLNPLCLAAWTLLGQEYMELKNSNDAIQSYSKALEINKYEYRAWYGLGQTYEILGMFKHSLYYFKQAQLLRPFDSRMIIAVGSVYEKLGNIDMALQSYLKGRAIGDDEKLGLVCLAKLYVHIKKPDEAAKMFLEYIDEYALDEQTCDHSCAYMFLANYYLSQTDYESAIHYAQKCLNYADTKEEAKALLKTIMHERINMDVDHTMSVSMCNKKSKNLDYDKEIPRQLQMLSLSQKKEIILDENEEKYEEEEEDEEEFICNRASLF
ncbi:cell division cycle protein 23 homolog isoform X2 [Adelges cooleyi]|uniref:cell division cycle protein 23 homolog isoform X2 n=1 Tax=Adelges cooleyi TaxID=133065 RepID=UPI00217F539B|nr:cell division cycle protein 23 homolog isoform X2 [Adelges cooleyi]XP_050430306.1 cell division cycle protein 23 homolog isoform X2 [Adelges cooleyi]